MGRRVSYNVRTEEPVLELRGICKSYGRPPRSVSVLDGVSLSVHSGETVWLRGESGSGKSSLLRVAGLLSSPDSGEVRVAGMKVDGLHDEADLRRGMIGFVFQQSNLLPDLTVAENVAIAGREIPRHDIYLRLERLGLKSIADSPAKQISGGEAQRVAFCRATVNDPVLLLVDEPTSGLDAANAALVCEALASARGRGRAILVASHDPLLASVADRVLVMSGGRLV